MNMNALLQQAKKMQKEVMESQKKLEATDYKGESQWVTVIINGSYDLKEIKFKDDVELDDNEMLEDMLLIAFNDAINKIKKDTEDKLGKYSNMMPGF